MNILVTGAKGFVGKNLVLRLKNLGYTDIAEFDVDTPAESLPELVAKADFVFHLAGVNRPENREDFMKGNFGFTSVLLSELKKARNKAPVLITSSIQAALDNPYGESKKAGEDLMFAYAKETGAKVLVYRLLNVFGKWCRPNYNSAIATFCSNVANNLPIKINDPSVQMRLVYIDDVMDAFVEALRGREFKDGEFCAVPVVESATLGEIADIIKSFPAMRENLTVPNLADSLANKLYSTYLSYLPRGAFAYPLKTNVDERGSFTEILKAASFGQVSVNVAKVGIVKGNHWHDSKNEKFLVVSGKAVIRFRKVGEEKIDEYFVSGDKLEFVEIPTGYTHNIENVGDVDLVTVMWCNESYNPQKPDTYFQKV